MRIYFLLFICMLFAFEIITQDQTVGLLEYIEDDISDGYTLIFPRKQSSVFLLNNCGEIVHEWKDDDGFVPNNAVYLMSNGNLVKCKKKEVGTSIGTGGGGFFVEIRSWENDLIWSYELNNENARLHHDVEVLPSGNILMIAWEKKTLEEAEASGKNITELNSNQFFPDFIFEVNPILDQIVWEWHAWDHLIQDYDSTKSNYGIIRNHPELIDINFGDNDGSNDWDWLHINAIDYNEELDQIIVCVPYFNELWIIDHSTTTEEAASHVGGNSGKGGDLLYRVGNPRSYQRGGVSDQILFFPHDAHWANEFVEESETSVNELFVFNNKVPGGYSKMERFIAPMDYDSMAYLLSDSVYMPSLFKNSITHPDSFSFYSPGQSSVQLLTNNNILACSGTTGQIVEISPLNKIVWEYIVPFKAGDQVTQGTELEPMDNITFRAFKYPTYYSAFDGKELSSKGFIELNPTIDYCDRLVGNDDVHSDQINIYPNPVFEILFFETEVKKKTSFNIYNLIGVKVYSNILDEETRQFDISCLTTGIYFLKINGQKAIKLIKAH